MSVKNSNYILVDSHLLFPQEFLNRSVEHLFKRSTVRSQVLYASTLLFIVSIFRALPFVYTEVGKSPQGVIVPAVDRVSVVSSNTGFVAEASITENAAVEEEQLLLTFQTEAIQQQLEKNSTDQARAAQFIGDLKIIIQTLEQQNQPNDLASSLYRSEWAFYLQEQNELQHELSNQLQIYTQTKTLYEKEVVSETEFEQSKYKLEVQRLRLLTQSRLKEWENTLNTLQIELETLKTNKIQLLDQQKAHYVYAPISGTLQNTVGISKNSVLYANQVLAEISPDTSLIAELYITPNNIGLIREGMPARFQIDAFNYNEWGHIEGTVVEAPNDTIVTENGEVVFIVRCAFNKTKLTLANGYVASLKKGMTLQGRFILARKSLFQLLYDNVDDWLNPTQNQTTS